MDKKIEAPDDKFSIDKMRAKSQEFSKFKNLKIQN